MTEERERAGAAAEGVHPARPSKRTSQGKLAALRVGSMVAYAIESIRANVRRCRVGLIPQRSSGKSTDFSLCRMAGYAFCGSRFICRRGPRKRR